MKYNILIAESYSCQRDLILNLIESSLRPYLKIYACHRQWRSDILDVADESFLAPQHDPIPFILKFCLEHEISLVFCGKNTSIFEQQRALFEQQGIILITGAQHGLKVLNRLAIKHYLLRCVSSSICL